MFGDDRVDQFLLDVYKIETCEDCCFHMPRHPSGLWCDLMRGENDCLQKLGSSENELAAYHDGAVIQKRLEYHVDDSNRPDISMFFRD